MTKTEKEVKNALKLLNEESAKIRTLKFDTPEWIEQAKVCKEAWDKFQEAANADTVASKNLTFNDTNMNNILNHLFVGSFLKMWKCAWYFLLMLLLPALYENYFASNSDGIWEPFSIWAFWIMLLCGIYSIVRSLRYER